MHTQTSNDVYNFKVKTKLIKKIITNLVICTLIVDIYIRYKYTEKCVVLFLSTIYIECKIYVLGVETFF